MGTRLIAPHPMTGNVAWSTAFEVEAISRNVLFITDVTSSNGMSVTNNMEMVLTTLCHYLHITEDELSNYTIYTIEDSAVYRIDRYLDESIRWIYMGPDDKAIRVLYGS